MEHEDSLCHIWLPSVDFLIHPLSVNPTVVVYFVFILPLLSCLLYEWMFFLRSG